MKTLVLVALSVTVVCGGCAHQQGKPEWIAGEVRAYPATRYLLGRGEGATQQQAADRARAELAKVFRVAITDETIDSQTVTTTRKANRKAREQQSEATRTVTTRTDELLEGIEVARVWHDAQTGGYYALAVLARARSAQDLRRRMQQLDLQTEQDLKLARADTDRLRQIGAMDRALEAQNRRQSLQQYLTIVEPTANVGAPTWNQVELRSQFTQALRRVHIDALASSDPTGKLQAVLAGAVSEAGFTLGAGDRQTDYVARAGLRLHELVEREGWYWLRGTLELQLTEPLAERVRGVKRWTIKVSAQQPELTQQRLLDQVSAILQKELGPTIIGFGGGA
jgi:LPP20 lipoprotein